MITMSLTDGNLNSISVLSILTVFDKSYVATVAPGPMDLLLVFTRSSIASDIDSTLRIHRLSLNWIQHESHNLQIHNETIHCTTIILEINEMMSFSNRLIIALYLREKWTFKVLLAVFETITAILSLTNIDKAEFLPISIHLKSIFEPLKVSEENHLASWVSLPSTRATKGDT